MTTVKNSSSKAIYSLLHKKKVLKRDKDICTYKTPKSKAILQNMHAIVNKRYHKIASDSAHSFLQKGVSYVQDKDSRVAQSKIQNYIYVKLHETAFQENAFYRTHHMLAVNTSTRPLLKQAIGEWYLSRQSNFYNDFDKSLIDISQPSTYFEEKRKSRFLSKRRSTCDNSQNAEQRELSTPFFKEFKAITYKRIPLPVPSLSFLQCKGEYKKTSLLSLNSCREMAQRERVCSLKKQSVKQLFNTHKYSQNEAVHKSSFEKKDNRFSVQIPQKQIAASKSVWKVFSNAFMRDGAKLRYQNLLRKALLVL